MLLFIFIRVVHSGLPFVIQNGDNQGICKKRHGGAIYGIAGVTIFVKFPMYTKISLVIWQDIGYTLRIPI